jgi:iron complex outermembrane recepter protein
MAFVVLILLLGLSRAAAQEPVQPPPPDTPPQFDEQVDVVGVTPIHGLGVPKSKVPANVQVFTVGDLSSPTRRDVAALLSERAVSVHINESQGGTLQPDVLFRGFSGSPFLGSSEGLAVYQDGVRVNEAFGDTINWDALPSTAIASVNVIPGSNPLFGLNTLGGALSIRMKDGFAHTARRLSLSTGSFGRHRVEGEAGGHGSALGYYVAGSVTSDDGWRDYSPSTLRNVFGDVGWHGAASRVHVSVTAASNDLTSNGPAPIELLEEEPSAVFTHPDQTGNTLAMVSVKGSRRIGSPALVEGVGYYRYSRVTTFNGDTADDEAGGTFDALNNRSRTRSHSSGGTVQVTTAAPLLERGNHFIAGAGVDSAAAHFNFASEWAHLTPTRGTIGSGLFDDEAAVDLRSRATTASAFVTNIWSPAPKLSITGSARFNFTDVALRDQLGTALTGDHTFGRLNPAAGVTYQLRPDVNLYGSYTESSRVPTPVELTCADPEDPCRLPNAFVSDPPLDQIVARTWEAGARGGAGRLNWSLSAYATASNDDIIFVSSGALRGEGHFENVDRTLRRGLEASVTCDLANRLSVFANYTLQRATFGTDLVIASRSHPLAVDHEIPVESGSWLPGVPAQSAKLGASGALTSRLHAGLALRSQSGVFVRGDEGNLLDRIPGFAVVDAHARYRVTKRLTIAGDVSNLFGAEYYTFGVLGDPSILGEGFESERFYSPAQPRAWRVGVEARF